MKINSIIHNNTVNKLKQNRKFNNVTQPRNDYLLNSLSFMALKNYNIAYKKPSTDLFDVELLKQAEIPNFNLTNYNGVRGEALSSPKNRKLMRLVKKAGIDTVIDLREKYSSSHYKDLCEEYGLNYYRMPINAFGVPSDEIIEKLPEFFGVLDKGNYYIACAQGLHRTDIALATNYVFNPKTQNPPLLYGHIRDGELKIDDIGRRLNSIYRQMDGETLKKLGWKEFSEETFRMRKNILYDTNRKAFDLD